MRVIVVRYGAFGDHVYITPVIRQLHMDGHEVTLETNWKGYQIHADNPRIKEIIHFDPLTEENVKTMQGDKMFLARRISDYFDKYDSVVCLQDSLEGALIEPTTSSRYWWPLWMRRAKNAHVNYYDQSMMWAGYSDAKHMGHGGEIWFPREDHAAVGKMMEKYKDRFVILWALRGSMYQKAMFHWARNVIDTYLEKHPEAVIITTGDEECRKVEWTHPQVVNMSGRWPFRQAALTAAYVDMVVAPETGLGVVAGAYGTPKIMFLTAASLKNVVGNDKNDYSMQSPAYCSPCTRAIYDTMSCPKSSNGKSDLDGTVSPLCVDFGVEEVLGRIEEATKGAIARGRRQFDPSIEDAVYV